MAAQVIAALFVEEGGIYYHIPGVDPWPVSRDARKYDGPNSVVAHPPCERFSPLAHIHKHKLGMELGNDGGCFLSALTSVRRFGGILEHPARSFAWKQYCLLTPTIGQWAPTNDPWDAYVTAVYQSSYGHKSQKLTWLYCVGCNLIDLNWSKGKAIKPIELMWSHDPDRFRTPMEFAKLLVSIAEGSSSGQTG